MVLFDEDPVELMREATDKFHIAPEKECLSRTSNSLHLLAATRNERIQNQSTILSSLSRKLNNLKGQYDYEEGRHDAGRHASEMLKMDTEKFKIAKGVSDAEIESERLSGELAALRQQLDTLEKEGVEGGARRANEEAEDAMILKLNFYRSLGIDIQQDSTTGEYNRAIVRNSARGDVNVIDVEVGQKAGFYPKQFWDSL